jgi:hypothetical protein
MGGPRVFARLLGLEHRVTRPDSPCRMGLTLLGLWLLVPLSPETLLFGAGDLRHLVRILPALSLRRRELRPHRSQHRRPQRLAVGLVVRMLCARLLAACLIVPLFLLAWPAHPHAGAAILIGPGEALAWLTAGARSGLLAGGVLLAVAICYRRRRG